jgi:hypothetical protein
MQTLRISDGKIGAGMGRVYLTMVQLDQFFSTPIDGVEDSVREGWHDLFTKRWNYWYKPWHAACGILDPAYLILGHDLDMIGREQLKALYDTFKTIETEEHSYTDMRAQFVDLNERIRMADGDFARDLAFKNEMASYKWWQTWVKGTDLGALAYAGERLTAISASASGNETAWSTEGWFLDKRSNRTGIKLINHLVRGHTNLHLERRLDGWDPKSLAWDFRLDVAACAEQQEMEGDDEMEVVE